MNRFAHPDAAAFLLLESSERPLHMGGLQFFSRPEGSGPEFAWDTYEAMRACTDVSPLFAGHPAPTPRGPSAVRWRYEDDVDVDDHLRYTSLPAPGGQRELFELISRLHGRVLDRRKPLWEVHVIDGLNDGRFAVFTKAHHALFDGVSFLNLLRGSLSTDPQDNRVQALWSQWPESGPERRGVQTPARTWRYTIGTTASSVGSVVRERELFPALRAPRTMFNVAGFVPWHCAGQSWSMERIGDVMAAAGATVNDVAMAMCAGALRAYLAERDALPDVPLVALVPISLRTKGDAEGRNLMSSGLCNLATHVEDPAKRLDIIRASMSYNKQILKALPRQVAMYLAGAIGVPISDGSGWGMLPPQFNVGISHVFDAQESLYHNGARFDGTFGFPPTLRGHALNIGLASNAKGLNVALTGGARALPDLERLLGHVETSLKDLERAVGL
jgi:diacylglycerol O-acyltransferase